MKPFPVEVPNKSLRSLWLKFLTEILFFFLVLYKMSFINKSSSLIESACDTLLASELPLKWYLPRPPLLPLGLGDEDGRWSMLQLEWCSESRVLRPGASYSERTRWLPVEGGS